MPHHEMGHKVEGRTWQNMVKVAAAQLHAKAPEMHDCRSPAAPAVVQLRGGQHDDQQDTIQYTLQPPWLIQCLAASTPSIVPAAWVKEASAELCLCMQALAEEILQAPPAEGSFIVHR